MSKLQHRKMQIPVHANTCVSRVGEPNQNTGVPVVIKTRPILNYRAWVACLASHPDRDYVNRIIEYTIKGVPVGYIGPRTSRLHDNWKSARIYLLIATQFIKHYSTMSPEDGKLVHSTSLHSKRSSVLH